MNHQFIRFPLMLLAASLLASCSSVPKHVLATMSGDTISVSEYENMYLRTRMSPPMNMQDKQEFLETYLGYRLKLLDARARGLDADPSYQQEVRQYRNQLASTFLMENELIEPGIRTLYNRRLTEIHLQHIIVKWEKFPDGSLDTLTTRQKAEDLLARVRSSDLPFDTLVMRYSDDGSKERTRGVLGWIIAGTSFPELDDMIYAMEPGEITPHLLRTVFGYHIFKVRDKKPARQRLRPAHILYRLDLNNPNDTAAAFAHLSLVLDSLERGLATFEELARRNSQDTLSGASGGDLGWMTRGTNIEPRFEDVILSLEVGEHSRVFRTAFGMHIAKLLDEEPPEPLEKQRDMLKQVYRKERFATDFLNYVNRKRREYDFRLNDNVANRVLARVDSGATTSTPEWEKALTTEDLDAYLFRTSLDPVTVREAIRFSKREPAIQMRPINRRTLDTLAMMVADQQIMEHETRNYEETEPEFRRLLREYAESALISLLEEQEIWSKVDAPEPELRAWWEQHREDFRFPPRVKFAEIYTYTEKLSRAYLDSINAGADFQKFAARYTQRPGLYSSEGSWEFVPYDANELSAAAARMKIGEVSQPIRYQSGFSLIKVLDKEDARVKTFEEARSAAVARYKEEKAETLRRDWQRRLREKYQTQTWPEHLEYTFPAAEASTGEN
ncbi:MAG: peptidylprolyl isomerase [Bacteroidetes bacterium]|nr:peptidylprolyl isomerase [Bacteroidota bacterium]